MNYLIFRTKLGWCGVIGDRRQIREVILPAPARSRVARRIKMKYPDLRPDQAPFQDFIRSVRNYFETGRWNFRTKLNLATEPGFHREVYRVVRKIPPGTIRTYGWVARQLKKPRAARAVGNALARNPWPLLVPCHRVIRGNGTLGQFSALAGPRLKEKMLALERGAQ